MAEASAHKLSYVAEATIGTTPENPRFQHLPDTRTTLALLKDTLSTERLTGNRFPAQPRTGARTVGGEIPADLSFGAYDDFIASALQGDWVDAAQGADTVTLTVDGTPTALTDAGDTFTTPNGTVSVEKVDAVAQKVKLRLILTADGASSNHTLSGTTPKDIDGVTFEASVFADFQENATVKAGDTRKSFTMLREFSDLENDSDGIKRPFLLYKGCEIASWNLSATSNALAKSTFTIFGLDMDDPSDLPPAGTSYRDPIQTEAFDTFSGSLEIDSVAKCIVTDYNLTVNNGHAARYTVGCQASQEAMVTQSLVEGSITAYFDNMDLYNKFIQETAMSLKLTLSDSIGNKLIVNLPLLRIVSGTQPDVSGDGSITIPINFTAHEDVQLGTHLTVQRIAAIAS